MSKIRINELARELEVKPHRILESLPELGIDRKMTHSSSLDEDIAAAVRRYFAGEGKNGGAAAVAVPEAQAPEAVAAPAPVETPPAEVAVIEEREVPPAPQEAPHRMEAPAEAAPPAPAAREVAPEVTPPLASTPAPPVPEFPRPAALPIRPPLAFQSAPVATATEPAAPVSKAAPPPPPAPGGQPSSPVTPPLRTSPLAPRPAPSGPLRPGQILSGPRAPLPDAGEPLRPAPPARPVPSIPQPPRAASPAQPRPAATPGAPQPLASPAVPAGPRPSNLVGQPAARPVVPPRPDMVARLQKTQPAVPGAPRSPMPGRPPAPPTPGKPIYQGPVRPGQPLARGPAPGMPAGARPARGPRGMHPTSGGALRIEPAAPPPAEPGRRHQTKPGAGRVDRRRELDAEEGRLRPTSRKAERPAPPPIDREITIAEGITVKELSEKLGVKVVQVMQRLVERKIFATINQNLDVKLAEEIARDFGASTHQVSYEEETTHEVEQTEVEADRVRRAPVVTIMGHVDHGKTSLLDAIRSANVAAREAGGITQHIGAYHVELNGRKIVFIDTPGHEAFTRMRARGAKVTDIVILVVAADDGVMPQTLEAIDHAKAAKVPIIVAINKIDKPDAQVDRIKQQLSDRGLLAEDWGGDTVMVPVSAKAKINLDLLLEMILLVADMQDLKANPARPAMGSVLEAKLDKGRGPVATVLVRNGTLRVGDFFICGQVFGKVRAMFDDWGQQVKEAEPSTPVEVLGLDELPEVGDTFQVVTDTTKAKQIVLYRESKARDAAMAKTRITLETLHGALKEGEIKELNIIIKADVGGTAEVLSDTLQKLSTDKVRVRVIHAGVGAITESDVLLASTSDAIIIGFNVRPDRNAQATAEREKVEMRLHTIIYELVDEIKKAMVGLLEPVYKETYKGRAEVRETFRITKVGTVAGCYVQDGVITRDSQVRLLRDNVVIHTGRIDALKRFKNDASEVKSGLECGISLVNFHDIKQGDIIEAFVSERVAQEALV